VGPGCDEITAVYKGFPVLALLRRGSRREPSGGRGKYHQ
jgi:hypothetical protein